MTNLVKFLINGIEAELLSAKVKRNGDRTVDTMELGVPPRYTIDNGDKVDYIQDIVDVTNLVSIYNFHYSARDEGGYDIDGDDGTFTADFDRDSTQSYTKSVQPVIRFNADDEKVIVSDDARIDYSKQFDIIVIAKPFTFPTGVMTIYSKTNGGIGGGIEIGITSGDPGYVEVELFETGGKI